MNELFARLWKLGLQVARRGDKKYLYYLCRGVNKKTCTFKQLSAPKLDRFVWREFVTTLQDPSKIEKLILAEDFIIDKKQKTQIETRDRLKADLEKLEGVRERTTQLYQWGDFSDKRYQEELKRIDNIEKQTRETYDKLQQMLQRPKEVKAAVKKACQYVAKEMEFFWSLGTIKDLAKDIKGLGKSQPAKNVMKDILAALTIKDTQRKRYKELLGIVDELKKRHNVGERIDLDDEIRHLIFQQRRMILQGFIDFDDNKGIKIMGLKDVEINFSIDSLKK
jgi:hypothetical protein